MAGWLAVSSVVLTVALSPPANINSLIVILAGPSSASSHFPEIYSELN